MIFCSTSSETSPAKSNAALENIDLGGAVKLVANRYGSRAQTLADGYHKAFPRPQAHRTRRNDSVEHTRQKDGWTMWLNYTCYVTKDLDKEARKAFTK